MLFCTPAASRYALGHPPVRPYGIGGKHADSGGVHRRCHCADPTATVQHRCILPPAGVEPIELGQWHSLIACDIRHPVVEAESRGVPIAPPWFINFLALSAMSFREVTTIPPLLWSCSSSDRS